jgi:signal transduction histidine kinase
LFQILREAVRDALAHSGCERSAVWLRITGVEAVGVVEDDGRGLDTGRPGKKALAGSTSWPRGRRSLAAPAGSARPR